MNNTLAAGPNGAYDLRSLKVNANGELLVSGVTGGGGGTASEVKITDGIYDATITNVGGKHAVDVNVADITIDHANDSIKLGDGTNLATVTASGALKVDASATTQPVSGSVSVSNFPASQAVTGTFYQATQPVSIASMPTTPVTGTFFQSTQPVSLASAPTTPVTGTFWQSTQPVSIATMPSTPVTGTFWPATQPVSGTVTANTGLTQPLTDTQIRASALPVSGPLTDTQIRATALPVSGTFFQATQPVSIASMPSTPVTGTFFQATQPVSGTVTANAGTGTMAVSAASLPLPTGASTETTLAAINTKVVSAVKGTQAATAIATQDLKDSGRNAVIYHMTIPVVTTATDALQSLTGWKSNAAVAGTTTPAVVTAGKTLSISSVTITYVAIATAGSVKFTLRANTAGVVAIGSPVVCAWVVGGPAAVAGVAQTVNVTIPDGLEFPAACGIGISMVGLSATQVAAAVGYGQIVITGFEY